MQLKPIVQVLCAHPAQERIDMNIVLPDGSTKELAEDATIADVAASIGTGLAKAALGGKIDGAFADLGTPVHDGAVVEIIE